MIIFLKGSRNCFLMEVQYKIRLLLINIRKKKMLNFSKWISLILVKEYNKKETMIRVTLLWSLMKKILSIDLILLDFKINKIIIINAFAQYCTPKLLEFIYWLVKKEKIGFLFVRLLLEIHCLWYRNIYEVLIHNQKICFLLNYKKDTSTSLFSQYFYHHSIPNTYNRGNYCTSHKREFLNKTDYTIIVVDTYRATICDSIRFFSLFIIYYNEIFLFECCLQSCLYCWSFGLWFSCDDTTRGRLGFFEITAKK